MTSYLTPLTLSVLLSLTQLSAHATEVNLHAPDKIEQAANTQTRGVLRARQTANIAAAMSARILKAPYKAGQSFKRGARLIQFDCGHLSAQKNALIAAQTTARLKHENIKELLVAGAAGQLEETLAAAEVHQTTTEIAVINTQLKNCEIRAPYAGIVQETHVSAYDTPAINTPLLSIIRQGAPEIKLIAPSSWLAWLKPGTPFKFTIDETQMSYMADIVRTGASVDPVSQTIELTARFKTKTPGALAGMSGVAHFSAPTKNDAVK